MSKFKFPRMDASENAFFSRQLEHIRSGAFEVAYPQLKGRTLVPVSHEVNSGAEEFTYRVYNMVGKAEVGSDYSSEGPRADIFGAEYTSKVKGLKSSYGYSIQEARAAMMAGLPLSAKKARAARWVVEKELDEIIWLGNTDVGLTGLANQSGTSTYTVPAGIGGTTWEDKTPDEIVADLCGIQNGIVSDTKELEIPDTLVLPLTSFNLINSVRMGDGSDTTILRYFLGMSPYVKSVESSFKLETAGAGSTKRMICYNKSPDKLEAIIPQEFEQLAPEQRGYEVITQCHARSGGVVVYYPKSISYGDGI